MNRNEFINIPAAEWAKANIPQPIENNPEWGKFVFLFAFFAITIVLFFVLAVVFSGRGGEEYSFFQRYVLRNACLAVFFLPFWIMLFYVWKSFARKIKIVDSEGVTTVLNKKYQWQKLHYIKFATYNNYTVRIRSRARKNNVIEVFFENGMADTFYTNQKIVDVMNQIPAQKQRS